MESSSAGQALLSLCAAIDAHLWDALPQLLHPDFRCRYVHTGEEFDRAGWVRPNATYPGFDRMVVEELVAEGDRAVARCAVTSWADEARTRHTRFVVATFVTTREGLIDSMVEVWTDVEQSPPEAGRRMDGA